MELDLALLMTAHFVGDFVLQSNWMATNKSKRLDALLLHCVIYAMMFLLWGITFAGAVFVLHTITDFFTSRWSSRAWFLSYNGGSGSWVYHDHKQRSFFLIIGFDQWLHAIQLLAIYAYFA